MLANILSKSWNGQFFERVTLKSLNCRIQLGHPIGEPCLLKYPASGDSFVVIDTSGVHEVGLDYCGCKAGGNEAAQLLRFRLYPATVQNPNTAATFRSLHHFQLLSFESKCSAYEYFQTLVRESDNTGLKNVKVCSSFISLVYLIMTHI
jgi:KDZ transposase family protein